MASPGMPASAGLGNQFFGDNIQTPALVLNSYWFGNEHPELKEEFRGTTFKATAKVRIGKDKRLITLKATANDPGNGRAVPFLFLLKDLPKEDRLDENGQEVESAEVNVPLRKLVNLTNTSSAHLTTTMTIGTATPTVSVDVSLNLREKGEKKSAWSEDSSDDGSTSEVKTKSEADQHPDGSPSNSSGAWKDDSSVTTAKNSPSWSSPSSTA